MNPILSIATKTASSGISLILSSSAAEWIIQCVYNSLEFKVLLKLPVSESLEYQYSNSILFSLVLVSGLTTLSSLAIPYYHIYTLARQEKSIYVIKFFCCGVYP